jgi:hypothetical protein
LSWLTSTDPQAIAFGELGVRLAIDLLAIAALAYGLYYRRHRRRELLTVYVSFNIGVFIVVTAISLGQIAVAVGFGLFAVLAMIRLRSEPYSHQEFAYFFLALVIALACGVDLGSLPLTAGLCALALVTAAVVDHPRLLPPIRPFEVTLELVFADQGALRRHLEERLSGQRHRGDGPRDRLRPRDHPGPRAVPGPPGACRRAARPEPRCAARCPRSLTACGRSGSTSSSSPPGCSSGWTSSTSSLSGPSPP